MGIKLVARPPQSSIEAWFWFRLVRLGDQSMCFWWSPRSGYSHCHGIMWHLKVAGISMEEIEEKLPGFLEHYAKLIVERDYGRDGTD
jgi:hypothetical protein